VVDLSIKPNLAEFVRRIIDGDPSAEEELVDRYKTGIAIIIRRIVTNDSVTEDLSQDTFLIALEKIRSGGVRQPERLSGFVCGVARNLAREHMRGMTNAKGQTEILHAADVRDPQPDQFERLLREEKARIVRQTIGELKPRDRDVITRFFLDEQDKSVICAELELTSQQFNSIISRALKRYRQLYIRRSGNK